MRASIVRDPIDVAALLDEVARAANGATVLFTGTVREQNEGRTVSGIEYAAYIDMAQRELATIVREACTRFGTEDVVAVHRIGHLAVGEASVAIAAAHPHRNEAFEASRYVIEQIKVRLPVWKREAYVGGGREWVGAKGVREAGNDREAGSGRRESGVPAQERDAALESAPASASSPSRPIPDSRFPLPDSRSSESQTSR